MLERGMVHLGLSWALPLNWLLGYVIMCRLHYDSITNLFFLKIGLREFNLFFRL